jgi:hypothetical protein
MSKYRKKPVIIEAEQFLWPSGKPVPPGQMFIEWPVETDERGVYLTIPTLEGNHRADSGDWIITGVKGERYPCKPDIFTATYEPA